MAKQAFDSLKEHSPESLIEAGLLEHAAFINGFLMQQYPEEKRIIGVDGFPNSRAYIQSDGRLDSYRAVTDLTLTGFAPTGLSDPEHPIDESVAKLIKAAWERMQNGLLHPPAMDLNEAIEAFRYFRVHSDFINMIEAHGHLRLARIGSPLFDTGLEFYSHKAGYRFGFFTEGIPKLLPADSPRPPRTEAAKFLMLDSLGPNPGAIYQQAPKQRNQG